MTVLARIPARSSGSRSTLSWQVRSWLIRSNHFLVARLPAAWIYWFAFPHEIWHYVAARLLGLRARILPGLTLFEPAPRWQTTLVLVAPATLGLLGPVLLHLGMQAAGGKVALVDWPMLMLWILGWWSGCLGDLTDVWLLVCCRQCADEHKNRTQHILARLSAEQTRQWHASSHAGVAELHQ